MASPAVATCLPADAGLVMHSKESSAFQATLSIRDQPIRVGVPFAIAVTVCGESGAAIDRLTVDATMPAHRHGMNYVPKVVALGSNRYEATGLLFHMPGNWKFVVSLHSGGKATHLTYGIGVK